MRDPIEDVRYLVKWFIRDPTYVPFKDVVEISKLFDRHEDYETTCPFS